MADSPAVYGVSLCTGGGGLERGVERAMGRRVRPLLYVEREAFAAAYLAGEMEAGRLDHAPVWSDLTTIPEGVLGKLRDVGRQHPLVLTAGFPCQPFSSAGKRRGKDDERWIWSSIDRILRVVRPGLVVLENVPGITLHGLDAVAGTLAEAGYSAGWDVVRASEAGAPHQRARWFCVAHRDDDGLGRWWEPEHGGVESEPRHLPVGRDPERGQLDQPDRGFDGPVGEICEGRGAGHDLEPQRVPDAERDPLRDEPERGRGAARPTEPGDAEPRDVGGEPVGDSECEQLRRVEQWAGTEQDRGQPRPADGCEGVADASDGQLPQPGWRPEGRDGTRPARPFPPGPSDDWSRVPRHLWPALTAEEEAELEVRVVAHGLDPYSRVDMLRLLGNGVVPQQAELAVRLLLDQLRQHPC